MNSHKAIRRLIEQHFSGRIQPEAAHEMNEHCASCVPCREYYERHLLLSELDPTVLGEQARIGRALGLHETPHHFRTSGVLLAVAAAALLVLWPNYRPHTQPAEFAARGSLKQEAPKLEVYRVDASGKSNLAADVIQSTDELAFAYTNPGGYPYLMIFGVDEHGHICWYHPAWTDPAGDPQAIAVGASPSIRELTEAISQPLDGHELRIVALFSRNALHVRAVEQAVESARQNQRSLVDGFEHGDAFVLERAFQVNR